METMQLQKGNPVDIPLYFTDADDEPIDITGMDVLFTVKRRTDYTCDDAEAVITEDISVHTDPTNGETTLSLSDTQTNITVGKYKGDLRLYAAGVIQYNTETFDVEIVPIVTLRT